MTQRLRKSPSIKEEVNEPSLPEKSQLTTWIDSNADKALRNYVLKKYGSRYRNLGMEITKAIIFYLKKVDTQQSFTIPSNATQLSRDTRRRLNAIIIEISKLARTLVSAGRSTLISHTTISELIKNTLKRKDPRTVRRYIELLLQHDMKRTIGVSDDPSSSAVLYDVAAFARVHSDNLLFKDFNRSNDNNTASQPGEQAQDEDRRQPENQDCRSERGSI